MIQMKPRRDLTNERFPHGPVSANRPAIYRQAAISIWLDVAAPREARAIKIDAPINRPFLWWQFGVHQLFFRPVARPVAGTGVSDQGELGGGYGGAEMAPQTLLTILVIRLALEDGREGCFAIFIAHLVAVAMVAHPLFGL